MNCPKCQAQYTAEDKFCPGCGSSTATQAKKANACSMCDAELPKGAEYCTNCGSAKKIKGSHEAVNPVSPASETPGNVLASIGCLGVIVAILVGTSMVDADPRHDAAFVAISYMLMAVFFFGIVFLVGASMRVDAKKKNKQRGLGIKE